MPRLTLFLLVNFLEANTGQMKLADQIYAQAQAIPHSKMVCRQIQNAIEAQNPQLLKRSLDALVNLAHSFYSLEEERAILEQKNRLTRELCARTQEFKNVITNARALLEHNFATLVFNEKVERNYQNLKTTGIKSLFLGAALYKSYTAFLAPEAFSLANLTPPALSLKMLAPGLWGTTLLAITVCLEVRKYKKNTLLRQHLNQMIFALSELRWQMQNLFFAHRQTLQQFLSLLERIASFWQDFKVFFTHANLLKLETRQHLTADLTNILDELGQNFLQSNQQILHEELAFMCMTKVMRALRKDSSNPQELFAIFSSTEKLASINPVGVDLLLRTHSALQNYWLESAAQLQQILKGLNVETLEVANSPDEPSWLGYAKFVTETAQFCFNDQKLNYYTATISQTIADALQTLDQISA